MQLQASSVFYDYRLRIYADGSRGKKCLPDIAREERASDDSPDAPRQLHWTPKRPAVSCVIWDISEGGARLAIALPSTDLPTSFTLNLFPDGSVQRNCEVVWTDRRFVGVKFNEQRP
jgi:hypothetical protein